MKTAINPFSINTYPGEEFFCDREEETVTLIQNIKNNSHTAFFALRRLGKTSLIQHVFHLLKKQKNRKCIYIDIYATSNLKDFSNQLANCIYNIYPEKTGIGKKFWELIKLLRPIISIDPLSGSPELSLDISESKTLEKTVPQLLQFLEQQTVKTVVAIDEFQQILEYPEKNVEAILRTAMQPLKNVTMIFCGSNQAMMQEIFNSAKRPFYASCKTLHLQHINETKYLLFIQRIFNQYNYKISKECIEDILEYTQVHTYYTQVFCNELFEYKEKNIQMQTLQVIKQKIEVERVGVFFQYRNLLTSVQWNLLKAVAKEVKVFQPYNKTFINTHKLGSSAIVKRSLDALLDKEMVYRVMDQEKPYYAVYDKFLMRWLKL